MNPHPVTDDHSLDGIASLENLKLLWTIRESVG